MRLDWAAPCPECSAPADRPCQTTNGVKLPRVHLGREWMSESAPSRSVVFDGSNAQEVVELVDPLGGSQNHRVGLLALALEDGTRVVSVGDRVALRKDASIRIVPGAVRGNSGQLT